MGYKFTGLKLIMTFSDAMQHFTAGPPSKVAPAAGRGKSLPEVLHRKPTVIFSSDELKTMTAAISRDFAPVFAIKQTPARARFSASELLEISDWISRVYRPTPTKTPEFMLLPIDPEHVYVYWNLEGAKPVLANINDPGQQLVLRIFSQASADAVMAVAEARWIDIEINQPVRQQKIALPIPVRGDEAIYSAAIGLRYPDQRFVAFSESNPVQLPRQGLGVFQSQASLPILWSMEQPTQASSSNQRLHASGQR